MRIGPALIASLLALPGLAVLIGGINEVMADSSQFSNLLDQIVQLAQEHSDILSILFKIIAALMSLFGVAVVLMCSKI